jgi:hypothetical protein
VNTKHSAWLWSYFGMREALVEIESHEQRSACCRPNLAIGGHALALVEPLCVGAVTELGRRCDRGHMLQCMWRRAAARGVRIAGLVAFLMASGASADSREEQDAHALRAARQQVTALPERGPTEAAFVPRGWSVEDRVDADLDGDESPDRVLVLLQDEREQADRHRALLVLLRRDQGFMLGGRNFGLLPCWGCTGMKGGHGEPTLKVERGVLLVEQFGGSREVYASLQRFRWSRARGRFELIGRDTLLEDSADGSSTRTSCNLLTLRCEKTVTPPGIDGDGEPVTSKPATTHYKLRKQRLSTLEQALFLNGD